MSPENDIIYTRAFERDKIRYKMPAETNCKRCGNTRAGFEKPPFPGAIGARVVEEICQQCWQDWLKQQTMLINHYGLNVMDPQARQFLTRNMQSFLFGSGQADEVDTSKKGTISH